MPSKLGSALSICRVSSPATRSIGHLVVFGDVETPQLDAAVGVALADLVAKLLEGR
jgi:hypothetical protein